MGVRRANATARECRTTATSCPAKVKPPVPITLGEDVPLDRRAHSPPQGDHGVNAHTFQPDESECSPPRK
jgi:hypothetical protein